MSGKPEHAESPEGNRAAALSPRVVVSDATENDLLQRLRCGDPQAAEALVRANLGHLLAVARRLLGCEHDAADAVQEAFQSAFRSIAGFAGHCRLSTWLHRVVVNVCLMKLRSERSRPKVSIESLLPTFDETGHHAHRPSAWAPLPDDQLQSAELRAKVRACIDQLPESYRSVLLLRDIEELDTHDTAQRLGISVATTKVRLHRARQALRGLLEPALGLQREPEAIL